MVYCAYKEDAFLGEDMGVIFQRVREYFGPDKKVAIFLDNATIHRAWLSRNAAVAHNI